MNYNEFIQNILDSRGRHGIPKDEYKETHHIIPKCMGGTDDEDNLIDLYGREHYEAHRLLYLENQHNSKLAYAFWCISTMTSHKGNEHYKLTAEEYEEVNKIKAEARRGTKVKPETIQKSLETRKRNGNYYWSEERKQYRREHPCHWNLSENTKIKISNSRKGIKFSEEHLTNLKKNNGTKGKIIINDGTRHYYINESELTEYINNGFKKGRLPITKEHASKIVESRRKGKGYIPVNKIYLPKDIEEQIYIMFDLGVPRTKISKELNVAYNIVCRYINEYRKNAEAPDIEESQEV